MRNQTLLILTFSLACLLNSGCVSRRMVIRTQPTGALVEVDGQRVGFSPVSLDFDYYADREIRISQAGYETLTVTQPVRPPWYQVPPLDFVSDNLLPFRVTNRHDFFYKLTRKQQDSSLDLIDRANSLKSRVQSGM